MSIGHAMAQSAVIGGGAFAVFWPVLTWWLRRWYERHWWHPLYEFNSPTVRRRLLVLGGLWALLPASYCFTVVMIVLLTRQP